MVGRLAESFVRSTICLFVHSPTFGTTLQRRTGQSYTSSRRTRSAFERCLLMTTDPGDLVLDPTCGSGTTAYVAEQWGRRWITIDTSRVPLALARQRLLTATFPWYELKDDRRRSSSGFVYKRKQNKKGEEVGGIVPHITLRNIATNEPPSRRFWLTDRKPTAASRESRVRFASKRPSQRRSIGKATA